MITFGLVCKHNVEKLTLRLFKSNLTETANESSTILLTFGSRWIEDSRTVEQTLLDSLLLTSNQLAARYPVHLNPSLARQSCQFLKSSAVFGVVRFVVHKSIKFIELAFPKTG